MSAILPTTHFGDFNAAFLQACIYLNPINFLTKNKKFLPTLINGKTVP